MGFILRKSYKTKKGTKVKSKCIKSTSPYKVKDLMGKSSFKKKIQKS